MQDFFTGIKTLFIAVISTASVLVIPTIPSPSPATNPTHNPEFVKLAPENPALPINEQNYIYISGTYSYLGQSVNYLALVPKKGGNFSASVSGACDAQATGEYEGGEGGKIKGSANGSCSMFGQKVSGSANFEGKLFPERKTIELNIENSPVKGINIKYN